MALAIAQAPTHRCGGVLLAMMQRFWTGLLMRINAWIGLLQDRGWIDTALGWPTPATTLEETAAELYATPWPVFALITVPLIAPALIAGWLLSFILSLDDVVVASLTSGPGASRPTPELSALATVIVVVVAGILTAINHASRTMRERPAVTSDERRYSSPSAHPNQPRRSGQ